MNTATRDDLTRLLAAQQPPCVSIYLPTEQAYPDRQQVPIRYANLVERAEQVLRERYTAAQGRPLLERLRAPTDDRAFWEQARAGLAVLACPASFDAFGLRAPPPERVSVGDTFLLGPLFRAAQSADRFHVLCLQRRAVRLYEGDRDGLTLIEPAGVPGLASENLQGEAPAPEPRPTREAHPPGHAPYADTAKVDAEPFFREVDRAVWERVSKPSGLPLVLVALPEQQAAFRAISVNPQLLKAGVERGPGGLADRDLLAEVWKCVEPEYLSRLERFADGYNVAMPRGQATGDLCEAARAALDGRVGVLLVEADRKVPGHIDPENGSVRPATGPDAGDALDELAESVFLHRGDVVVVPRDRMPTATGLAAVYRF
jgi:hypothetical protein